MIEQMLTNTVGNIFSQVFPFLIVSISTNNTNVDYVAFNHTKNIVDVNMPAMTSNDLIQN